MRDIIFVLYVVFFNFDGPPVNNGRASIFSFLPDGIFVLLESNVWMDDTFVVGSEYSTDSFVVDCFKSHPSSNDGPTSFSGNVVHPSFLHDDFVERKEVQGFFVDHWDFQRRTLELPKTGNFVEEI